MNKITPVGVPLHVHMDIMYKQLIINKPKYSPMGMFTLRRSLIITVIIYFNRIYCSHIFTCNSLMESLLK